MLIFVVGQFMAAYKYSYEKCIGYFQEQNFRRIEFPHTFFSTQNISAHLQICTFRRPVCWIRKHYSRRY